MAKAKLTRAPKPKATAPREDAPGIDLTGTITSFTAESPTTVTMDQEDTNMLDVGDSITLEPLTGDPDAMTAITGAFSVTAVGPIKLGIDLSAANVDGLTADFTREMPDPADLPPPNHQGASVSPGPGTLFHPSPGVGSVPVEGWVPPEGWTPPQGWQPDPPSELGLQPGDQFETPPEDKPDTIPGGRELADKMKREDDERDQRKPPKPTQMPADPPRPVEKELAGDFDDIARREGIK